MTNEEFTEILEVIEDLDSVKAIDLCMKTAQLKVLHDLQQSVQALVELFKDADS